jgi:hypothetical protein
MWRIERISKEDETVYLCKTELGTKRKFCVPGALTASLEDGLLCVQASTGWVWSIVPETGARRRFRKN